MPAKKLTDIMTTGQIARILCVAPRTVVMWADKGWMKCHRIFNGGSTQHRRIRLEALVDFMVAHNMPLTMLAEGGVSKELVEREMSRINKETVV